MKIRRESVWYLRAEALFDLKPVIKAVNATISIGDAFRCLQYDPAYVWEGRQYIPKEQYDSYYPGSGTVIRTLIRVGIRAFNPAYTAKLYNEQEEGGDFLTAIEIEEDPALGIIHRYVVNDTEVIYNGNSYKPLSIELSPVELGKGELIPNIRFAIPSFDNSIATLIERRNLLHKNVTVMTIHSELLGVTEPFDKITLPLQGIASDPNIAVIEIGFDASIDDRVPSDVIAAPEFPALPESRIEGIV